MIQHIDGTSQNLLDQLIQFANIKYNEQIYTCSVNSSHDSEFSMVFFAVQSSFDVSWAFKCKTICPNLTRAHPGCPHLCRGIKSRVTIGQKGPKYPSYYPFYTASHCKKGTSANKNVWCSFMKIGLEIICQLLGISMSIYIILHSKNRCVIQ